jgi:hypothetical protein
MTIHKQLTTESSSDADSIIFWPSGLGSEEGWIVGWWLDDIWLVAGIVCGDELDDLTQKLVFLKKNACFCCSCDGLVKKSFKCCGGCTRKLCFGSIEVLAYSTCNATPLEKISNKSSHAALPLLQVSPEQIPVYITPPGSSAMVSFRQVVVYDRCLDESLPQKAHTFENVVLYTAANVYSQFSQNILGRISHANVVIQAIHFPVVASKLPIHCAGPSAEDKTLEGVSNSLTSILDSLPFKSYFLEHVQNAPPFVRILRVLFNARQANTRVHACSCTECEKQYHTLMQSHYSYVDQAISRHDDTIRWAVDLLMGFSVCFVLSRFGRDFMTPFTTMVGRHFHWLRMLLDWMENFPIGFKLNVKLTIAMGKAAKACLNVQEVFLDRFFDLGTFFSEAPFLLWSFGLLAGGSGMLNLFCDVWRLTTLHLAVLAQAFHFLFSVELFVLRSSWRLFRGKKRNILRQRTDTMNYDSTQLLFGTILFTAALFLFTTILVYDAVFFSLRLLVLVGLRLLLALLFMIQRFRWGRVWLRLVKPNWFAVGAHLVDASPTKRRRPPDNTDLTILVPELAPVFIIL